MHCAGLRTDHLHLLLIFGFSNTSPRFPFVTCVFWLISSFLKSSAATEKFFPLVISLSRACERVRSPSQFDKQDNAWNWVARNNDDNNNVNNITQGHFRTIPTVGLFESSGIFETSTLSQVLIHDSWALPFSLLCWTKRARDLLCFVSLLFTLNCKFTVCNQSCFFHSMTNNNGFIFVNIFQCFPFPLFLTVLFGSSKGL